MKQCSKLTSLHKNQKKETKTSGQIRGCMHKDENISDWIPKPPQLFTSKERNMKSHLFLSISHEGHKPLSAPKFCKESKRHTIKMDFDREACVTRNKDMNNKEL